MIVWGGVCSFGTMKMSWNWIVGIVAQSCEYAKKKRELYIFNGEIYMKFCYMNYIQF